MDAYFQRKAAAQLLVLPRGARQVFAENAGLDHHVRIADRAHLEHGLRQAVEGIAPEVLGDSQRLSGFSGGLDDRPACPDGDAQRLLDEHVLACLEGEASYNVMGRGIRNDVERVELRLRLEHGGNVPVGARAGPEKSLGDCMATILPAHAPIG